MVYLFLSLVLIILNKNSKKKKSSKKESKRKVEVTTDSNLNWKVGDHCVAVYTEDGVSYPAVIIDINNNDKTCRIRYDIYENEEHLQFWLKQIEEFLHR